MKSAQMMDYDNLRNKVWRSQDEIGLLGRNLLRLVLTALVSYLVPGARLLDVGIS